MRALHIPPNNPTPIPTKPLHAFVPVSSFGSSPPLRTSFSLCGGPATEQAATAQLQSRLLRAIGSMLQGQTTMVATLQAEGITITATFLLLFLIRTEQANKSGGTLATIQGIRDSAQESHTVVKDEHHCCRALLFASHAIVRSGSNGKQRWQP